MSLVCVSVVMNFRMGQLSGNGGFDGTVYGIGAAAADCLKALLPFMAMFAARNRERVAAYTAVALFCVLSAFSFSASLGFAGEHREARALPERAKIARAETHRNSQARLQSQLDHLGVQRPTGEVAAAIKALLEKPAWRGGKTVGQVSSGCSIDRTSTRAACAEVAALKVQHAASAEYAKIIRELNELEAGMSAANQAVVSADVQVDAIRSLIAMLVSGITEADVSLGLSVLLSGVLELGSGFGLFVVTTPWRAQVMQLPQNEVTALGDVDSFMLARVQPSSGASIAMDAIWKDYRRWCSREGMAPLRRTLFEQHIASLAKDIGIQLKADGKSIRVHGVAFIGSETEA